MTTEKQELMNGYYSETAAYECGYAVYRTPDGGTLKITEVISEGRKPVSMYKDLKFVGKVIKYAMIENVDKLPEVPGIYATASEYQEWAKKMFRIINKHKSEQN